VRVDRRTDGRRPAHLAFTLTAVLVIAGCGAAATPTPSPARPSAAPSLAEPSVAPSATSIAGLGAFPEQPDGVPWPTEEWARGAWPSGVDRAAVEAATDTAMADGGLERVRATIIVHGGAIVFERYSPNSSDGPDVVYPSYSVAKSVTSALVGILVRDGRLTVDQAAPVPEWHEDPADPRAAITVEHLLHMSTGMPWEDGITDPDTDMTRMVASDDMAAYAAAQVPTMPIGEAFEYNSGSSTLLARIIGDVVGGGPEGMRAFMDRELFERIGMNPVETYFDPAGTWGGAFSADALGEGFAKFGLLFVRGGVWDGEEILPTEWVNYTRTSSPAYAEYGAHWWLDPLRPGLFYAVGIRGTVITVDPAHDLVIVQAGTVGGDLPLQLTETILNEFAEGL
jgi:CubicO group peptidase (beta-lactamase class C family)